MILIQLNSTLKSLGVLFFCFDFLCFSNNSHSFPPQTKDSGGSEPFTTASTTKHFFFPHGNQEQEHTYPAETRIAQDIYSYYMGDVLGMVVFHIFLIVVEMH